MGNVAWITFVSLASYATIIVTVFEPPAFGPWLVHPIHTSEILIGLAYLILVQLR